MSSEHKDRLGALRARLAETGLDGLIIPRSDEYLGEYVPPCAERLAWITSFTGSAGLAIVLAEGAAVFSDGRYTLQLQQETDAALWERRHIIEDKPEAWLRAHAEGKRIGYDPWLISPEGLKRFAGVELVPVQSNPIDEIWADRPAPPLAPAVPHPEEYAGESAAAKRARLAAELRAAGQDAAILTDPASLAWLFNIRGNDLEFCPFALGYALLRDDASALIFMAPEKVTPALRAHLGAEVTVLDRAALPAEIAALKDKTVHLDPATQPVWFEAALREAGANIATGPDLVALPRALKNPTEQAGARAAHLRDGVAMVKFFAWMRHAKGETEISAAAKLLEFRAQGALFRGESFPPSPVRASTARSSIIAQHPRATAPSSPTRSISSTAAASTWTAPRTSPAPSGPGRAKRPRDGQCHPRAGRAYRPGPRRVPRGRGGRTSGRFRPRRTLARGAGLRPRHRPWRRLLSFGA